jgi:signal transduction histidine kinase
MEHTKTAIITRISRAKIELEEALEDLEGLPMLNPIAMAFIAQALSNYLRISTATVDLIKGADSKDTAEVLTWLEGLHRLNERMTHLVDRIRSKPRENSPQLRFEKIDLATLVGRACDFYRPIAARKRVEIVYAKPTEPLGKVRADRIAVAAVLDNLLSNATKHSTSGKHVWVALEAETDRLVCRVKDEGPGIEPIDRDTLFSGDSPDSTGLCVAAKLLAQMGGEIECESEPGHGACIAFGLPCRGRRNGPRSIKEVPA